MNEIKMMEIVMEIYRKMYREAQPKADFDELVKTKESLKRDFFMRYYLPMERQEEIMNEVLSRVSMVKHMKERIKGEIYLGCSPNSCKDTWENQQGRSKGEL